MTLSLAFSRVLAYFEETVHLFYCVPSSWFCLGNVVCNHDGKWFEFVFGKVLESILPWSCLFRFLALSKSSICSAVWRDTGAVLSRCAGWSSLAWLVLQKKSAFQKTVYLALCLQPPKCFPLHIDAVKVSFFCAIVHFWKVCQARQEVKHWLFSPHLGVH